MDVVFHWLYSCGCEGVKVGDHLDVAPLEDGVTRNGHHTVTPGQQCLLLLHTKPPVMEHND